MQPKNTSPQSAPSLCVRYSMLCDLGAWNVCTSPLCYTLVARRPSHWYIQPCVKSQQARQTDTLWRTIFTWMKPKQLLQAQETHEMRHTGAAFSLSQVLERNANFTCKIIKHEDIDLCYNCAGQLTCLECATVPMYELTEAGVCQTFVLRRGKKRLATYGGG